MSVLPRSSRRLLAVLLAGLCGALPHASHAQRPMPDAPYESDILSARPVRYFIGLAGGMASYYHLGEFSPGCDCVFSRAHGTKAVYGGELSVQYPKLGVALKVLVLVRNVSAEFERTDVRTATVIGGDPDVDIAFRNTSTVTLTYASVIPALAFYYPATDLFAFGGVDVAFPTAARYDHVEAIQTPGYAYYDGSTTNVIRAETDIPGGRRVHLGIVGGLGYDWYLTERFVLTPQAGVTYLLTPVSTERSDETWKVVSGFGTLLVKVRL